MLENVRPTDRRSRQRDAHREACICMINISVRLFLSFTPHHFPSARFVLLLVPVYTGTHHPAGKGKAVQLCSNLF